MDPKEMRLVGRGAEQGRPSRSIAWGPEHLFAALVAVFGTVFALVMPPIQTPDEPSHFHRAYQVSEGILITHPVGEWGGADVPESVLHVAERFSFLAFHPESHVGADPFQVLHAMPLRPQVRRSVPLPGSAYYSFVPYVPQAVGLVIARVAGCGPLGLMYAGRLANLAVAVVLVFFAVRIIPVFKLVLGMVALLPITVQQFASQSPDASTIGVAFLLTATFLRAALEGGTVLKGRAIAALFGLAAWVTLCKFPYGFLALLVLAIPAARFGGRRRFCVAAGSLLLLVAGIVAGLVQLKGNTPDRLVPDGRGASMTRQTDFIRRHPLRYAKILASTVAEHGKVWVAQLSMLGWLDTPVNAIAMHLYLVLVVVVGLGERSETTSPTRRLVVLGVTASILCFVVILTSCYVSGCAVRAPLIIGPQGRYFVPFTLLLLLPLYNGIVRVHVSPRALLPALAGAGCTGQLLVSVATIVRRYYFPLDWQPVFSMVSLMAALMVIGSVVLWVCAPRPRPQLNSRSLRVQELPPPALYSH